MIMIDVQLAGLFIYKTKPELRVNYSCGYYSGRADVPGFDSTTFMRIWIRSHDF